MDPEYVRAEGYESKRIQGHVYWTWNMIQMKKVETKKLISRIDFWRI